MKKLQILVPQYKETDEIIKPLLDSIAIQRGVDFNEIGVIIANDGTDVKLSDKLLTSYPYEIKYIQAEHGGVSHTRNVCMDNADAEYIMFCDADDCFCSILGLQLIIGTINNLHFDALQSTFLEEFKVNDRVVYNKSENAHVFVHGKVYRLQYIKDIELRWCDELTYHEDGYFNAIALMLCPNRKFINIEDPFYLWCYNKESVSRRDPYFLVKTYDQNIKCQDYVLEKLKERNRICAIDLLLTQIYQTFFICTGKFSTIPELNDYFKIIKNMTKNLYLKYKDLWNESSREMKVAKRDITSKACKNLGYFVDPASYTIDMWLEDIIKEV